MKTTFFGYYSPSPEQYERLWEDGLIVLDTNVLLNLYRLPTTAKDELISVLELLKERLWIPHQVALEFQRRRLTVISSERKSTEDALEFANELVADIRKKVEGLQIEKRGLGIDSQPLLLDLEQANSRLKDAIAATHSSQLDISASDPVRDRLDVLLEGRVGAGPADQGELDALTIGGEDRYKEKIPPGFMDADKEKNPAEATFMSDHIKYQRKFGDLILWRQVIQHAKANNIKTVLLITADRKEDWWWREQGKTIGPHAELVREIKREAAVDLFWMYSSVQFVEHANKYSTAKVSNESVAEIQNVARTLRTTTSDVRDFMTSSPVSEVERKTFHSGFFFERPDTEKLEQSFSKWLSRHGEHVEVNSRGFPDFLVQRGEDVHGYEIKRVRNFDRMTFSPLIVNTMLRGYMETKEGRLSGFSLVVAIQEEDFFGIINSDRTHELERRLGRLMKKYPISSIIVGAVLGETFEVLTTYDQISDEELFF